MSAAKEYLRLRRNIGRLTDGQVSVCDVDWDSGRLDQFRVVVSPNSGIYKAGKFVFRIRLPNEYPCIEATPSVYCETNVLHPNIDRRSALEEDYDDGDDDDDNNVCLNLFDEDWRSSYGLESIALGLLFLMHNPNFDSPLIDFFEESDETESIIAIKKNMEYLRITNGHEEANSSDIASGDKNITEAQEAAEAHVSENKNNTMPSEPKDVPVSDVTNENLQQIEDNISDAKEGVNIDKVVGETPDGVTTTASEDQTGSKEELEQMGETMVGMEIRASAKKGITCNTQEYSRDERSALNLERDNKHTDDEDAMHICVTHTSEQYVEVEENEDLIHTRLVAFDGEYVLFGGTDSEQQELHVCVT